MRMLGEKVILFIFNLIALLIQLANAKICARQFRRLAILASIATIFSGKVLLDSVLNFLLHAK